jgi:hypothetical protein
MLQNKFLNNNVRKNLARNIFNGVGNLVQRDGKAVVEIAIKLP